MKLDLCPISDPTRISSNSVNTISKEKLLALKTELENRIKAKAQSGATYAQRTNQPFLIKPNRLLTIHQIHQIEAKIEQ
jgi:hypothetical protein